MAGAIRTYMSATTGAWPIPSHASFSPVPVEENDPTPSSKEQRAVPLNILHIDSSILGENSASRILSSRIADHLRERALETVTRYRDLEAHPLSHLHGSHLAARGRLDDCELSLKEHLLVADTVLQEFFEADVIVIGAPMYNFTVPTQLKAWIDRVLIAGKTFRYTEAGPVGLAGGKRVIVALTRGGVYDNASGLSSADHQEPFLRTVFTFIGIQTIEVIRAEGLAISSEHRKQALETARQAIQALPYP